MKAMMIRRAIRNAGPIGAVAMLLALPACDRIGNPLDVIRGDIPAPDEFQVLAHKPLEMPATADLPEPRPGAASPLDPDPHRDAQLALLGSRGSVVVSSAAPGAGEQVLLSSANAASASSEIRVQIEQDKIREEANKPYKPPSLFSLLSSKNVEELDETTLLDPAVEARRLQAEGNPTPVDPNAGAEIEEVRPPPARPTYPAGKPQSPFKGKAIVPTY
jgi:hypothetical protein